MHHLRTATLHAEHSRTRQWPQADALLANANCRIALFNASTARFRHPALPEGQCLESAEPKGDFRPLPDPFIAFPNNTIDYARRNDCLHQQTVLHPSTLQLNASIDLSAPLLA
jgi:hypothetical protein